MEGTVFWSACGFGMTEEGRVPAPYCNHALTCGASGKRALPWLRSRLKAELQQGARQGWSSAFRRLRSYSTLVASRESLVELIDKWLVNIGSGN